MKKLVFGIVVVILLGYGLGALPPGQKDERPAAEPQSGAPAQTDSKDERSLTIKREDVYKGDLLLINLEHSIPKKNAPKDVVKLIDHQDLLMGAGMLDADIELPLGQLRHFSAMAEAAMAEGVTGLIVNSGYRSHEEQAKLYEQLGSVYANPPGFSEHQLGLSMDLGSSQGMMKDAPEGEWLRRNAWKHGFVLRYPEDKTDVTGVIYEPWHFRYVGLPHSSIMQERGFVLEEYLAYLKVQKRIRAEADGIPYEVAYYRVEDGAKLAVPVGGQYSVSGNNTEGVIVTTWGEEASLPEGDEKR